MCISRCWEYKDEYENFIGFKELAVLIGETVTPSCMYTEIIHKSIPGVLWKYPNRALCPLGAPLESKSS